MAPKTLTEAQIQEIIRRYQTGETPKKLGEDFNIANNSVTRILRKRGIERNQMAPTIRHDEEKVQDIIKKYQDGWSGEKIGKELKIDPETVRRILKLNNIKIKSLTEAHTKIQKAQNYFSEIDLPEKAYFLGLLYADCYNNNFGFKLTLLNSDKHILETLRSKIVLNPEECEIDSDENYSRLNIYSAPISNDLSKWGCTKAKSHTIRFPKNINQEFYRDFIRGYLDGDGCICIKSSDRVTVSFSSNLNFLADLKEILSTFNFNSSKIYPKKGTEDNGAIEFRGASKVLEFLDWLYYEENIPKLIRKHEIYLKIKNNPEHYRNY